MSYILYDKPIVTRFVTEHFALFRKQLALILI